MPESGRPRKADSKLMFVLSIEFSWVRTSDRGLRGDSWAPHGIEQGPSAVLSGWLDWAEGPRMTWLTFLGPW